MIREPKNQSASDLAQFELVERVFHESAGTVADRVDGFPKFASRQALAKFLARYEIFKKVLPVNGSIAVMKLPTAPTAPLVLPPRPIDPRGSGSIR